MENLKTCIPLEKKEIVSIIGSGGKTSLLAYFARYSEHEKVLISTTTKMGYPSRFPYDFLYTNQFDQLGEDGIGVTFAGICEKEGQKITALPQEVLVNSCQKFDKVFLEADGSKQLPLKGWAKFEPVVIPVTTTTIGIIPISVLGKKISAQTVHRLPIFLEDHQLAEHQKITEKTIISIIVHPNGIWREAKGKRILCLNQVETPEQLEQAKAVVSLMKFHDPFLDRVIACSIKNKKGIILWEK